MSRSSSHPKRRPVRLSIAGDGPQLRPGPSSPSRIYLTTHEILHGNARLTDQDRRWIKAFLEGRPYLLRYTPNVWNRSDEVNALVASIPTQLVSAYRTRSSSTVIGLDARGRKLFEIRAGSIRLCMGVNQEIVQFSTASWRTPRRRHHPAAPRTQIRTPATFCPVHHVQVPVSGICDLCVDSGHSRPG